MVASVSQFRGRALVGGIVAARSLAPKGWSAAVEGASPGLRSVLSEIDAEGWYPASYMAELLDCAQRAFEAQPKGLRKLAKETLVSDAGSAMEPVVRVLSPTWASRHVQSVWKQYADFGRFEFVRGTMHSAELELDLETEPAGDAGQLWCWVAGVLEAMLQIAGADAVQVRHEGEAGASRRRFDLRWD